MTVECNERADLDGPDTYHELVKSLSKRTCLKCNKRDGVLVCINADCPIVVHKDCMSSAAYFDDGGNFYCPYCAYKHSLDECRKAEERTILAKKALVSFLDTKAVSRTGDMKIFENSKRESSDGINSTFQKHIAQNGSSLMFEVPMIPDEIGEAHSGRVGDGTTSQYPLKDELRSVMMDNFLQVKLKSDNLKTKRRKTAIEMAGNCNGGVQRKQAQSEPDGMVDKDEGFDTLGLSPGQATKTIKLEDGRGRGTLQSSAEMYRGKTINSIILQDEYTSLEQLKANSDSNDQFAEIQKHEHDDAKNMFGSPTNAACRKREHDASVTHTKSDIFSSKHEGTKNKEEACYEEMEEKHQRQIEDFLHSLRKEDRIVTNRISSEGDVNSFHMTANFEDGGFGEHICRRTNEQQRLIKSVKDCTHSSRHMATKSQQNIDPIVGNYDGPAKKVKKQAEPQEPSKENADVSNEDAKEVNYSVHEENLSRSPVTVNKNNTNNTGQTSGIGDIHCKRADEGGKHVKLQKHDVIPTSKENAAVSYKEFDTADIHNASQEGYHMGYELCFEQKSQTPAHSKTRHPPRKSSGSSESDLEEYDEATHVESRQRVDSSKKIQHTPVTVRRKKLPWTIEEEEMLKVCVSLYYSVDMPI
ncbi:hypothetical protein RND81_14G020500 [Saponaria officinalis]|uniref:Zinc finger PHD-type domain-containing protein n=1 Tax=Saponaria officinalis TaxID=3572 RepID=A0AAW1GKD8_SAPOF